MSWIPNTARIAQPFVKVWTPRTPDSSYDSFGQIPAPPITVMIPLITESIGTGLILEAAAYWAQSVPAASAEGAGTGLTLVSATYTPPS